MTDRDLLLRACRREPLEDTPRLMLADWWEDNGDRERAEFMRLQIGPKSAKASTRASELFHRRENWRSWIPLPFRASEAHFERGLIARVECDCSTFHDHAVEVFAAGAVYAVRILDRAPDEDMGDYIFVKAHNWPQRWQSWRDSPYYLPPDIFNRLPSCPGPHSVARYPAPTRARKDLNAAALAYGNAKLAELESMVTA